MICWKEKKDKELEEESEEEEEKEDAWQGDLGRKNRVWKERRMKTYTEIGDGAEEERNHIQSARTLSAGDD